MMRSLFSAVSGLKTHQTRMDVIGNNIANVNTEAFKASSVRFSELMYQTMSTASGGDASTGTGGVNAKQVGLGVSTACSSANRSKSRYCFLFSLTSIIFINRTYKFKVSVPYKFFRLQSMMG